HEIVGRVIKVGDKVTKFKPGDIGGVGCLVDSCRTCPSCTAGHEQYCEVGAIFTYNSPEKGMDTPTYGGYSNNIVVTEEFVLRVSEKLDLKRVAPLLCAGITTFSPLKQWNIGKGHKVAVVGLGGLGHMAVKLATSMGADVTVLSTSPGKEADARELGAHHFVVTKDPEQLHSVQNKFDFIINTVSAKVDINMYAKMLRLDGTMVLLGIPPEDPTLNPSTLVMKRRRIAGSLIGGLPETQEMLDYCAHHNIMADVEVIPISEINTAYDRMMKSDVKYRFVIDMSSLK
ncbi:MAG: NAD(P)-dependent alcohol dehydrogenase, partial [Hymenobacteraceae bacterium]|nr:NAD(P)-dependent alcohol dehydrogenase [Hymenobacteraceae bacterium]MDX5396280.1 NAD(P)-dependent alcohol dehydrogenase [Hymenobacteraceae bacterium]MDX5442400.1 NAD(P)-dependent alcohol dehydrogenase [Hymenobacteraceae bacterium]MDX5512341.1 NAD(P)-dependent alcohol dehydrogenase [Hymenobacteraceae bacterium]